MTKLIVISWRDIPAQVVVRLIRARGLQPDAVPDALSRQEG
jgi:hypothetical protein